MDSKTETGAIQDEPGTLVVQRVRKFWGKNQITMIGICQRNIGVFKGQS